jgi:superfamily I DNA/RNA helicase
MKKIIALLFLIALGVFGYFKFFKKEDKPQAAPEKALAMEKNTDAFTASINQALTTYYAVTNALTKDDAGAAGLAAAQLQADIDTLQVSTIKADKGIIETAQFLKNDISGNVKEMVSKQTIEEKRTVLKALTDNLFNLLRTVQYNGNKVFLVNCPMAFNNQGAQWLNPIDSVVNPYFGSKMLHCGSTVDSLNFK